LLNALCGTRAALGIDIMAEAADEATAPAPKKSGGAMGTIVSGVGIFVLSLGAVIVGGGINAKLHPMPDFRLDKDGKMSPILPVAASGGHGEGGEGGSKSLFYAIDPPLVVNFEDGSVVRFLQITMELQAHDPHTIESVTKNIPLIRNNLLLLMSNRDYQSMMSREGKEKLRQEALTEVNNVQKKQGADAVDDLLFTTFVVQ
jgi:flagellar FliL protein